MSLFCFIEEVTLISQSEAPDCNITDTEAKEVSSCRVYTLLYFTPGLCSKGAQVSQATNFCLWATR